MSPLNEMLHDHENRVAVKGHELADVYPLFHQAAETEMPEEVDDSIEKSAVWPIVAALTLIPVFVFLAYQLFPFEKVFTNEADQASKLVSDTRVNSTPPEPSPRSDSKAPAVASGPTQARGKQISNSTPAPWSLEAEARYLSLSGNVTSPEDVYGMSGHPVDRQVSNNAESGHSPYGPAVRPDNAAIPDERDEPGGLESVAVRSGTVVKSQSGIVKENVALRKAKNLIFQGRRQEAISHLSKLLEVTPNADNARLVLAGWLAQDGAWEKVDLLLSGVDERSDQRFRQLKARMYVHQGNVQQAMILLEANMPDLRLVPEYYTLLGVVYQRAGRFSESVAVFKQLIQTDQARGDWWGGLAIGFDQSGDKMAALEAYQEALLSFDIQPHLKQYARQRVALLSRSAG